MSLPTIRAAKTVREQNTGAGEFEALERLRKLAFAETVPARKIPERLPIELPDGSYCEEADA